MCSKCGKIKCCCEKIISKSGPRGPRGFSGKDGQDGTNGTNGTNGADADMYVLYAPGGSEISFSEGSLSIGVPARASDGNYLFNYEISFYSDDDTLSFTYIPKVNGVALPSHISRTFSIPSGQAQTLYAQFYIENLLTTDVVVLSLTVSSAGTNARFVSSVVSIKTG
jgi:hypothetical protein